MARILKYGLLVLICLAFSQAAHADIASVSVSPGTRTMTLFKGESKSGVYKVVNNHDRPVHVTVKPRYWFELEENKDIQLDEWLKIGPLEFDLDAGETKEIAFTVKAPEDAKGELAAMIAFRPETEEKQPVRIVFSVSLYAIVLGTEEINYKISDFVLWNFKDREALGVRLDLNNTGNVHLKPRIMVFVKSLSGKVLEKADLEYGKAAYPGGTKIYNGAIYSFKLKPGLYKAVVDMEFTNLARKAVEKRYYFLVGLNGKILYTFFRRPRKSG